MLLEALGLGGKDDVARDDTKSDIVVEGGDETARPEYVPEDGAGSAPDETAKPGYGPEDEVESGAPEEV